MYLLRAFGVIVSTIVHGSISVLTSFFDPTGSIQNGIARRWARSLLWICGVSVCIEGLDRIDHATGSYVIASNHLSFIDTPVILAHIPVQFRFMAKEGLFRIPFLHPSRARRPHPRTPPGSPSRHPHHGSRRRHRHRAKGISVLVFR